MRMPVVFVAHGSPLLLDDAGWMAELAAWARRLPRPRAVLVISAHWEAAPLTVGATATVPLLYDFSGFPARYYEYRYAAPGAPALAARVRELASPLGPVAEAPERGLDHGAWVPLYAMYPEADVPVLQLSLPTLKARPLVELGRALRPLRDEGVVIMASGFLTHNLRHLDARPGAPVPVWAGALDAWVADVLGRGELDTLADYRERAPGVREALPTHEHFAPLVAAAAAGLDGGPVTFPITGFVYGSFSRRSVQFG